MEKSLIILITIGLIIVIGGTIYLGITVKEMDNQEECWGYQYPIYSSKGNIIGMNLKVCYIEDNIVKSKEYTLYGNNLQNELKEVIR
jgi:hypothetical protein